MVRGARKATSATRRTCDVMRLRGLPQVIDATPRRGSSASAFSASVRAALVGRRLRLRDRAHVAEAFDRRLQPLRLARGLG